MNTTTIIIAVIVVLLIVVASLSKHHKHKYVFHEAQVSDAISRVFSESGAEEMSQTKFLHDLQLKVNCSRKELFFLFGKARSAGMIIAEDGMVRKC
ncbi:MAG: type III effector protein [Prevotella sp.]|uniref:type III effector protein n=1 Tax=Prevotella sp. TaxID=59823 RepID=UPI0025864506|nr:type III effector protein [Prevotella sp.]MDD6854491.1 type III effector protein [Prevotella sp.]